MNARYSPLVHQNVLGEGLSGFGPAEDIVARVFYRIVVTRWWMAHGRMLN